MHFQTSAMVVAALISSIVDAQVILSKFVFGHEGRIYTENGRIPHFHIRGDPNEPDILSNRIVLTPPAPGNEKASIWADNDLLHITWVTDVDFRASGPERGGGNMNVWLVENGPEVIHADSIYTSKKWKGLGIVVDTNGGYGMIRGFLNDGSRDYSREHNVDSLAFGNCKYAYRNLGRPSQIKISQNPEKFRVDIDGNLCFETDQVQIPQGYRLGVSATTPDIPDSFEIFKMLVMSDNAQPPPMQQQQQFQQQHKVVNSGQKPISKQQGSSDDMEGTIPDVDASSIVDNSQQFADLHDRLQMLEHHVQTIYRSINQANQANERQRSDFLGLIDNFRSDLRQEMARLNAINELATKITSLEGEMKRTRGEIHNMIRSMEHQVTNTLGKHHSTLADSMNIVHSNHSKLIWLIIGLQMLVVGGYAAYKRKNRMQHVKYL